MSLPSQRIFSLMLEGILKAIYIKELMSCPSWPDGGGAFVMQASIFMCSTVNMHYCDTKPRCQSSLCPSVPGAPPIGRSAAHSHCCGCHLWWGWGEQRSSCWNSAGPSFDCEGWKEAGDWRVATRLRTGGWPRLCGGPSGFQVSSQRAAQPADMVDTPPPPLCSLCRKASGHSGVGGGAWKSGQYLLCGFL